MTNTIADIIRFASYLDIINGDIPETHRIAKILLDDVARLVKMTQPGVGDFKHTAKSDLMLTGRSKRTGAPSNWCIARAPNGEVWHTNGGYAVRGEPSKRLVPEHANDLPFEQMARVILDFATKAEPVTVDGPCTLPAAEGKDWVTFSNGAVCDRLYMSYVQSA